MYGPTEGTCGATIKRLIPGVSVTIGKPNSTTRVYILDSRGDLSIPGVIGEIYIAGIQVAKGYLNLPEETRRRFLSDAVAGNGEQMYRTGDKGYWNEDGEIVCLGRNDRQIKLRGFRLDMNDLEIRAAKAFPELQAIAITSCGDHLVAMVEPASVDVKRLLSRMSMVLPAYAIPQDVRATDNLPITRAGKIDYKAISELASEKPSNEKRGLRTFTERTVAAAYETVLNLNKRSVISASSSFLEFGGNSLQQISLSLQLTRNLGFQVPLQLVIEHSTVEDLARAIDSSSPQKDYPVAVTHRDADQSNISPIEHDWLKRYRYAGASCFDVAFSSTFTAQAVDRKKLVVAWNTVVARHPLLRCRYIKRHGQPPQRLYSDYAPRVQYVQSLDLWAEINRPFLLDRAHPVRVHIMEERIVVVLSHIVADYTALSILLREVSALYNGKDLYPVHNDYLAIWQSQDIIRPCRLDFWTKYLQGVADSPRLFGRDTARDGYYGTSAISELPPLIVDKICAYTQSSSLTLQQLATASVALCLQIDRVDTDIVIGTPYMNRDSEEALESVGLFLQPLPVRVQ